MATTAITPIDTQIAGLAQTFQTAIKATIKAESAPITRTQALKDTVDVRRGVYTDIKNNFDGLQSALQALISTQGTYGLNLVSKSTVTPGTTGAAVLTATNTESAAVADYDITDIQLAKAQSQATVLAYSPDLALNKSGTFWLGGTGLANLQTKTSTLPDVYSAFVPSTSVTAGATSTVSTGQRELGAGDYALETRDLSGVRQFRLVNADGSAVSIRSQNGTSYTNAWQNMTSGGYDTGRGLNLTLNANGAAASTALTYTAAGTSITINATDTLRTITTAINAASQPEGRDFKASIVANKLVLTGAQTGENHSLLFTLKKDGIVNDFLGFGASLQVAQNATFKVNGMDVSRAGNTNLTDVMDGATISLASDATGKSARLSIATTADKAAGLMSAMVNSFNTALSHLKSKLASTPTTVGGKTTYTRGPLSGEQVLTGLRQDMLGRMNSNYTNSGSFKNLAEIGLGFDKDMKLTLDSAKFSEALKNNRTNVTALLDSGLGAINSLVSNYAGSSGSLSNTLKSIDVQRTNYDNRILKYNEAIAKRKEALYNQYQGYQSQIAEYGYTAQWFGILSGTNVNTSG
ncbi:MAG: flagellar filament capping protein FliD [Chloroflexi bacterium]|nr:flagellar filament capping protein FliD [Chloroflexota bacterium]